MPSPRLKKLRRLFPLSLRDCGITLLVLAGAALICTLLRFLDDGDVYVSMVFLLAVLVISRFTSGYPGEVASTAGTSGVVYGIIGDVSYDPQSRVNNFAHVNHTTAEPRLGVMTCISGTGILNSWMKRNVAPEGIGYAEMNDVASQAPIGAEGVSILPFGNGAERVLRNRETGSSIHGVNFLRHNKSHLLRAAQEGIVFSFMYGMEVMQQMGMKLNKIHAGHANMFLSPLFRETLAGVSGATIELFNTDGSVGAAKGAGIGAGIYRDNNEAFATLDRIEIIEPVAADAAAYAEAYALWKERLAAVMAQNSEN